MLLSESTQQFIREHLLDDTSRLLLSAHRYPDVDVPFAVEQIESRRRLRNKLPAWYALDQLVMGGRIPAEQCSSEQTARFKRMVMLPDATSLCDMTGGMGVDFWYMSQGLDIAIYTERQSHLCEVARHNLQVLCSALSQEVKPPHYVVREGTSTELPVPDVDVIYLDPARRSSDGGRIYEISDCEPDVVAWQDQLLSHCRQLLTKVSPMADITRTVSRLKNVFDIYVVGVRNECKEVLISQLASVPQSDNSVITLHCVDFMSDTSVREFHFQCADNQSSSIPIASSVMRYFYEPDVCIMKAQGYAALASTFGLRMLDRDCHYFTSDELVTGFPGRVFVVDEQLEFSSRSLKQLRSRMPQANIATRNFPLSADQLRQRSGIRDGGEVYLFGASLQGVGPVLLRCRKSV